MSAIDFDMVMERLPDPKGDRVKITMSGKFLPFMRTVSHGLRLCKFAPKNDIYFKCLREMMPQKYEARVQYTRSGKPDRIGWPE